MNSKCDSQDGAEEGVGRGSSRENLHESEHSEELMCNERLDDNFEAVHSNLMSITGSNQGFSLSHSATNPVHKRTGETYGFAYSCSKNKN